MTLRRIYILIRHLPPDSSVAVLARDGRSHWSLLNHQIDDLRLTLSGKEGKPHPDRMRALRPGPDPRRLALLDEARKRRAARQQALADGAIP